jgi:cell division protein FtsI (penicillin-binding protein 3)
MFAAKVCAPVFREIANKIFAYDVQIHPAGKARPNMNLMAKHQKAGMAEDLRRIAEELGLSVTPQASNGPVRAAVVHNDSLVWKTVNQTEKLPNVLGMTLRDALPVLENRGYVVRHQGIGKVRSYSLTNNGTVHLVLN